MREIEGEFKVKVIMECNFQNKVIMKNLKWNEVNVREIKKEFEEEL